jgi:ABC-type glycerol-3-phosphate transport system permease component
VARTESIVRSQTATAHTAHWWRPIAGWGWSLLVLVVLGFVMFLPIVWMIAGGFKTEAEVTIVPPVLFPDVWHVDNFSYVVTTSPIGSGYLNSAIYVCAIVLIQVTTSTIGGYVFAKLRFPGRNVLLIGILATLMIPPFLIQIPLYVVMVRLGWLNSYAALIVPAMFTAFGIFLMRQFILGVPHDYIESARLDGCGEFRVIGQIVFPLVREPAAALAILIFLYHWNDLFWPLLVMRQQTAYTLSQALYYLQGAYGTNYHLKLAAAALVVIPPIVVYLIAQKQIMRGVALTGVKG